MADSAATVHEKLRSKHIRTLEALQAMVRENETLKSRVEEMQQALDLLNARAQVPEPAAAEVDLLKTQVQQLGFENNQLASQLEEAHGVSERIGEDHQRALQKMRTEKARLKREAGKATAEANQFREENEALREECIDLREKSKMAWELEVKVRSLNLEVTELKAEIERLKGEESQQRQAYVENLKKVEEDASASAAEAQKLAIGAAVELVKKEWGARLTNAESEHASSKSELERKLSVALENIVQLEKKVTQMNAEAVGRIPTAPLSPPAPALGDGSLEEISRLRAELAQTNVVIEELRNKIAELEGKLSGSKGPADDAGKDGFGAFIEMKRENQVLRAQIKDLMRTQQRILGGSSAKRVDPGRGLRRKVRR